MAKEEILWPGGPSFLQASHAPMTTDSILLADFARPGRGGRGIDLGCASGLLSLLLLWREETLHMTGLELLEDAAALAAENMARNGLADRSRMLRGDIRQARALFPAGSFDFAISDPPYFPTDRGARSPDEARATARSEGSCSLEELLDAARWLLRTGGRLWLVHRPERLAELFTGMSQKGLEPKRLRLVQRSADSAPSLALIEGRRGGGPGLKIEAPLLLCGPDGGESAELRRICHREK